MTSQVFAIFADAVGLAVAILLALLSTFQLLKDGGVWWEARRPVSGRRRQLLDDIVHRRPGCLNGYMIETGTIALFAAVTQWLIT